MPERSSLDTLQRRRHRRLDQRQQREGRLRRGGLGLGILLSIALAVLILFTALAYADLTRDLPNVALLPVLLNPPDGLLLQPTRVYDRTGQHLLFTFDVTRQTSNVAPPSSGTGRSTFDLRRYIPLTPSSPQHLPDFLAKATVVLADPGFWSEGGYRLSGLNDPDSHPTIAQKLVSDLLLYAEKPSLRRALRERILAAQLTSEYGRSQVLEWYLNSADYGNNAYGVDAAAQLYFGKSAADLTPAESAILAAASQAPSLNPLDAPDVALQRARSTVQVLEGLKLISADDAASALFQMPKLSSLNSLTPNPSPAGRGGPSTANRQPSTALFSSLVLHQLGDQFTRDRIERGGLSIITTLDYDLQQQTLCSTLTYAARLDNLPAPSSCSSPGQLPSPVGGGSQSTSSEAKTTGGEGASLPTANSQPPTANSQPSVASLVLDPQSGQVLAAVGETLNGEETSFMSPHDPGSLMTPFIYLTAFTRGFGPASLVWDIPPVSTSGGEGASPSTTNSQLSTVNSQPPAANGQPSTVFHGPVRIRTAMANDYLAPAQTMAAQMGAEALSRTESSFGLNGQKETLLDLAAAYGIFAANGVRYGQPGPTAVLRVEALDHSTWLDLSNAQAQPVVTPALAYLVNNVLSDEAARWPSLGHPNDTEIGRPAGVKLGGSSSGSDMWAVGYTPSRVVAVWVGNPSGGVGKPSPSPAVALAEPPSSLWADLVKTATASQPPDGWSVPPGVTSLVVCDPSGLLPTEDCPTTVSEVFLSGNEPSQPDTLFRKFPVNRETGYLATVFTPPDLVEDKVFMIVPPEAQEWAKTANIPVAPNSYDAIQPVQPNPDAHITAPVMFADVTGKVVFKGTASGANFDHYRLLVGKGLNPQAWIAVGPDSTTRIEEGTLGTWDTTGLSGLYAVELQVIRTDQSVDTAISQVNVK